MAITDPYCSVDEFKSRTDSTSNANNSAIASVLLAASRVIDGYCRQPFYKTAETTRLYTAVRRDVLEVGPIASVSSILSDDGSLTYDTTWLVTDYELYPFDAAEIGEPYREIRRALNGSFSFPLSSQGVRITGEFGWPDVPAPVKEVCFLMANRNLSLWSAPFGQSGGGEMGSLDMTVSLTPILKEMIAQYVDVVM